ncbi:hypothetical protein [Chitinophaga ginsengisoli]|uniref:Uncharacterized protein n=1 Tax=Chitinophaga ginsengisoli TaxID=363837 RepID=A0A2P8GHK1_9BACT|nr:hypothetical protein [Chitinophaga ginsengisoli]PSL33438.1 hypothetical protein CLV42_103421 [Chitinophaga ginsengisoli]
MRNEHLVIILNVRKGLSNIAELIRGIIDDIEKNFNSYTSEMAKDIVTGIFPIFKGAEKSTTLIIDADLKNEASTQLEMFNNEINDLREITNDLSRYKVGSVEDYNTLFND